MNINYHMLNKFINKKTKLILYTFLVVGILNQYLGANARIYASIKDFNYKEYVKGKGFNDDYILGTGDILNLFVTAGAKDLNNIYEVDKNGFIQLPRLGKFYVKGLTITEISKVLKDEYLKFVNFPDIKINIVKYKPLTIFVNGEVNFPGKYTFDFEEDNDDSEENNGFNNKNLNITLFDALQKAGGITNYSNLSNIKVVREEPIYNGGGKKQTTLNLLKVFVENDQSQNIILREGDNVYVERSEDYSIDQLGEAMRSNINPKFINIFVSGRVRNPGKLEISVLSSLNDAIDMVGGTKILKGRVTYLTRNNLGIIERRNFRYNKRNKIGSFKNPILKSGDVIFVGNSPVNIFNEVLGEVTAPFLGAYSTYKIFE